ncbi:hypothetical protein [Sphingomonas sp. 35-24ZXX]|uniref:hypothetical protein n=1 Tax=Sphingomonas sp. 35-24ZXX TaxID=1545915 RepID=UPI0012E00EF6|nr:hypothetical protein [Sphingomonas sp. 35-24ZXX]
MDQFASGQIHGGSKARSDVTRILQKFGVGRLKIGGKNFASAAFRAFIIILFSFFHPKSTIVAHFPIYNKSAQILVRLMRYRHKLILLVHDIDQARQVMPTQDISDLRYASGVMVSGRLDKIAEYEENFPLRRSYLTAWDYLIDITVPTVLPTANKILFAGSLDQDKSAWIYDTRRTVGLVLSGQGFDRHAGLPVDDFIGSFNPEQPKFSMEIGWGLVWDGCSIDGLAGPTGTYQRFNQPHKYSLYIAVGLPIICNTHAAIAQTVSDLGLGICVESLRDIPSSISALSEDERMRMIINVRKVRSFLINGHSLIAAFREMQNSLCAASITGVGLASA